MQIINHTACIPCCVVVIKYCYTCVHAAWGLFFESTPNIYIPWGRGRGTPYTHNLTTHHTSTYPNSPHFPTDHTSPLTTPPHTPTHHTSPLNTPPYSPLTMPH